MTFKRMILTGTDGKEEVFPLGPVDGDQCLIAEEDAREHLLYKARQGAVRDESVAHTTEYLRFIRDHDCATPEKFSDQWIAKITLEALNKRREECGGRIITFAEQLETELREWAFTFMLAPLPHEAKHQGLFAIGSVHAMQGTSAAGRTTLGIQMLVAQKRGELVFGRQTFRRPYLVIVRDRSPEEMERTLYGLGELGKDLNYRQVPLGEEKMAPASVIEKMVEAEKVRPEIVFVEGMDLWCEDAKEMKHVDALMSQVRDVASRRRFSLIATIGAPKMKPREQYSHVRDRGFGSSAWARKFDTVMDVDVDKDEVRHVQLVGRNNKPQEFTMVFQDGLLVLREPAIVVGPAEVPSVRELGRIHKCGRDKAKAIREELIRQTQSRRA